mgnify:CR=1 FL=1
MILICYNDFEKFEITISIWKNKIQKIVFSSYRICSYLFRKFFSNLWSHFFSPKKTNQCYIYQSVITNLKSWKRFSYICNFKFWQHSVGFRSERRETFRTLKYQSIFVNRSLKLKFAIRIRKKPRYDISLKAVLTIFHPR